MISLSNELYRNELVLNALAILLKQKGRITKRSAAAALDAHQSLTRAGKREFLRLVTRINKSYEIEKLRPRAVRNVRKNTEEYRLARVADFAEKHPDFPLVQDQAVRKINYWER